MTAGLVATVVLSLGLLLKQALGIEPRVDLITVLAHALGYRSVAAGWAANFVVGTLLWGPLYAWLDPKSRLPHWANGMFFASVIWLGVMLVIMPAAGEGLFGLNVGLATPTLTLFLHWVYGVALGASYAQLLAQRQDPEHWAHVRERLHWPHWPHRA
jgi:hypothetical protein